MADELEGVRALITGGGGGIGSEMAKGLARAGAKIIVADLDLAAAERIADEIGGWAGAIAIDVRDRSSVKAAVAHTVSRFGGIDAMFNNAGIAQVRQFLDITEDDFRTVMDVNALGVLIGIQEAVRQMQRQSGGGSIVNTASIAGKQGYEPLAHYSASKFAVVGMTQAAARGLRQGQDPGQRDLPRRGRYRDVAADRQGLPGQRAFEERGRGVQRVRLGRGARAGLAARRSCGGRLFPGVEGVGVHDRPDTARRRRHGLRLRNLHVASGPSGEEIER